MGRVLKFVLLIIVGFGLGAGLAWFQKSQQVAVVAPVAVEQPVADTAMVAADGVAAPADSNAMMAADAAPSAEVAGSSVGGTFALTDHNGVSVTDQSWPGKMKLVFFGFTACPDICPVALDKMTNALNTLGTDAVQIQPLFITVDPARDNMAALQSYLANYHSSILGLTGTEAEVKIAEDAYKVYATKGEEQEGGHYSVDHSGYVYLMTDDNKLLEIFGSDATAESMVEKIKPHLNTPATTEGGGETAAPVTEESTPADVVEPAPATEETTAPAVDMPPPTEGSTEGGNTSSTTEEAPAASETAPATEAPASEGTSETPAAE